MKTFGEYIRNRRIKQDLSLRKFCKIYEYDIAYLSRLENNREKPSLKKEWLEKLGSALGIPIASKEWKMYEDLAHKANNKLPNDITDKASEVLTLLPAFLRTRDNKRISNQQVEKLIKFLKK